MERSEASKTYEVTRSRRYETELDQLRSGVPRLDDVEASIDWDLHREPFEKSERIPGTEYWVRTTNPHPGAPRLRLVFQLEKEHLIALHSIRLA